MNVVNIEEDQFSVLVRVFTLVASASGLQQHTITTNIITVKYTTGYDVAIRSTTTLKQHALMANVRMLKLMTQLVGSWQQQYYNAITTGGFIEHHGLNI